MKEDINLEFLVTLWPTFPHFRRFALDNRLSGVRLNSAMIKVDELNNELDVANAAVGHVPLYFDIKGRQLRVTETLPCKDHLELKLNHPISVDTPTMVLFKAAADRALLEKVVDGNHLIFRGGPEYMVYPGESLHIRDPDLEVQGELFTEQEKKKIEMAKKAGFNRFFLSYVESQRDIDEFREYVGDSYVIAKIENKKGLNYVQNEFKQADNLNLMAATGDLYVEVDRPHDILDAIKLIIKKDPKGYVGSRILLSVIHEPVPSMSDLAHLGWLYEIGYRRMMLCDELCLKENLLGRAVNVLESFRNSYTNPSPSYSYSKAKSSTIIDPSTLPSPIKPVYRLPFIPKMISRR